MTNSVDVARNVNHSVSSSRLIHRPVNTGLAITVSLVTMPARYLMGMVGTLEATSLRKTQNLET